MLDASIIRAGVSGGWNVEVEAEVASTSDVLKSRPFAKVPEVLFAEFQTSGRGRRENAWVSPRGVDLMFSVGVVPNVAMSCWARATTMAAVAICRAIESETPLSASIKWPNDVLVEGKKVAGLLAETQSNDAEWRLILGVGLNVNNTEFSGALQDSATSLRLALGARASRPLNRESMAVCLLEELRTGFDSLSGGFEEVLAEARERSWLAGKQIRARTPDGLVHGRVVDLDAEGGLVLELPDGARKTLVSADEVRPLKK
jgi:BirA family biotin operon repressor/biotin-[acetyl-CoA-carboxylase] ligase